MLDSYETTRLLEEIVRVGEALLEAGGKPLTLRDARRITQRCTARYWEQSPAEQLAPLLAKLALAEAGKKVPSEVALRDFDRAISLLGSRWPLEVKQADVTQKDEEGEDRKKDTDEVAETSEDPSDGDLHGGDGNSGEVDAPAETKAAEPRKGQPNGQSPGAGAEETFTEFLQQCQQKAEAAQEATDREYERKEASSDAGRGNAITADIASARSYHAWKADSKGVKDVHRAINRFFAKTEEGFGKRSTSLRVDGRTLVKEMAQQSYRLNRTRRAEVEDEPGVKVFMVDVSGSCPKAHEAMVVALDLVDGDTDGNTILIVHSNGVPTEIYGAKAEKLPNPTSIRGGFLSDDDAWAWWEKAFEALPKWAGCIAWGDMDADRAFHVIAQRCPLVLLDAYAACSGAKPINRKWWSQKWYSTPAVKDWPAKPVAVWQGVNDFRSTSIALRAISKGL